MDRGRAVRNGPFEGDPACMFFNSLFIFHFLSSKKMFLLLDRLVLGIWG